MSKLSAATRHAMPPSEFALPGGHFPIEDAGHARAALIDVGGSHYSPAQKAEVKRKARAKLGESKDPPVPFGALDA